MRVLILLPLLLSLTLSACAPKKKLRPDPRACVLPSVLLVPRPLPELDNPSWRGIGDLAARALSHAKDREADIATISSICRK